MEIKSHFQTNKVIWLPLNQIIVSAKQAQKKPDEPTLLHLAASIRKNGLFQPLTVRRQIAKKAEYCLISGIALYYALMFLQAEEVPVLVYSFTEMEADLFCLVSAEQTENLLLTEQAVLANRLLQAGKMKPSELADALGITTTHLKELCEIAFFQKEEKDFLENHAVSFDFVRLYLQLSSEQKEEVRNHMIVKECSEAEAKRYMKNLLNPKKEPIKTASLSNDVIVMNSMERLADSLRQVGISASTQKQDQIDRTEYILTIEKKLKQLSLL